MKKTTLTLAVLMACALTAPAQAARYDSAAGAKPTQQSEQVAKKGKKAKAKKAKA